METAHNAHPTILEMRSITKEFPGVKALDDVSLTVQRRRDPRDLRRERRRQVHPDEGALRRLPLRHLRRRHRLRRRGGALPRHPAERGTPASSSSTRNSRSSPSSRSPRTSSSATSPAGRRRHRLDRRAEARAIELLARVGLDDDPDTQIKNIGVGKQQLVEIAKALNKNVKLLILDEPTAALNESDSQHLLDLIRGLKGKGITSIMISHKLNEIEQIADQITIIRDGKSIETLDVEADGVDEDRIIRGMVGRDLEQPVPRAHRRRSARCSSRCATGRCSTRSPPSAWSCKDSSFTVRRGEVVGFAGLMGAGRTELAMSIFGRSYGKFISGTDLQGRQGDRAPHRVARPSSTASPTSARTARRSASTCSTTSSARSSRPSSRKISPRAASSTSSRSTQVAERVPQEPAHQDARRSTRA